MAIHSTRSKKKSQWTIYHVTVFLLTFFSYSLLHATRKTFSNVKSTISDVWTPTFHNESYPMIYPNVTWNAHCLFDSLSGAEPFLGILDSVFLVSYAVGLYISGFLGDRFDLRKVLTFGMCSAAVIVFLFGSLTEWLGFYCKPLYVILWALNGLLQSTGWPTVVAVMANWFGKSSRGLIFGLWSACASVGNIFGALMVARVLDYGYSYAFLLTSTVLFAGGVVVFFGLVPSPNDVGLSCLEEEMEKISPAINTRVVDYDNESEDSEDVVENESEEWGPLIKENGDMDQSEETVTSTKAIGFLQAVLLPGVIPYSLAYACLKLVNYAFFFWLPFYLHNKFGWKETLADELSIFYDIGGIIGGTVGGFISDRLSYRSPLLSAMLICSFGALYGYSVSPPSQTINTVLMTVLGFSLEEWPT